VHAILGLSWSIENPERVVLVVEGGPHDRMAQEAERLHWKYAMNAALAARPLRESTLVWEDDAAAVSEALIPESNQAASVERHEALGSDVKEPNAPEPTPRASSGRESTE
jgi:hypothetical protein